MASVSSETSPPRPPAPEFDTHPLWQFSVAVYGQPGVRAACMALQDDHGFDVNVVLACLWQERRGAAALSRDDVARVLAGSAVARERTIEIRRLRRSLDGDAGATALREALLHAELVAENAVQRALYDALTDSQPAPLARGRSSLHAYAAQEGLTLPDALEQALLDADAPT